MGSVLIIKTLEQLRQFINENGIAEIALRGKNKKFTQFQKIALDLAEQGQAKEQIQNAVNALNKNNQLLDKALKTVGNVTKLTQLNLIMNGANLCATCVGFAIMYAKLNKISDEINKVLSEMKEFHGIEVNYEFNKILSEHANMLDCRKKKNNYSEDKMRELVDGEYNALRLLLDTFIKNAASDNESLILSINSLASMLAVSIKYFDEVYYFNNRENIDGDEVWHASHEKWIAIFDELSSEEFIKKIQDYGFFDLGFNTSENDYYYKNLYDNVAFLKQDISDNQELILAINDPEAFRDYNELAKQDIREAIEQAFADAGISTDNQDIKEVIEEAFKQVAVA